MALGKPKGHPIDDLQCQASKDLRRAQRQAEANRGSCLYEDIMTASEEDTYLMHGLINIQRDSKITTKAILFKVQLITDPQQVAHILADYYKDLTTP